MPGQGRERAVAIRSIGEPVVDLVAVDEQVVALCDPGQLVLDVVVEDGTGRVGRVAQEQGLRPRRDRCFDGGRIQREVVVEGRRHVDDGAACEHDRRNVGDVGGLVEDDLVARIARRTEGQVDGLRGPDGDQNLLGRVVADAVQAVEVVRECAAQLDRPVVGRVVRAALAEALDARLDDLPGSVEIRLSHTEADDVVHRCRDVEEAPDARRGYRVDALGEGTLGKRGTSGEGVVRHGRSVRHGAPGRTARGAARGSRGGGPAGR